MLIQQNLNTIITLFWGVWAHPELQMLSGYRGPQLLRNQTVQFEYNAVNFLVPNYSIVKSNYCDSSLQGFFGFPTIVLIILVSNSAVSDSTKIILNNFPCYLCTLCTLHLATQHFPRLIHEDHFSLYINLFSHHLNKLVVRILFMCNNFQHSYSHKGRGKSKETADIKKYCKQSQGTSDNQTHPTQISNRKILGS